MKRRVLAQLRPIGAIIGLAIIAMVVGGYILANQRLRFPFVEDEPFRLNAAFSTAQAVTPGQGQTVRVSGVRVGDIAEVRLEEGRAIVAMDLDPEFEDLVRQDATALLRPKTGLKDMFIELDPGSDRAAAAPEGWTLPVERTLPDVNADEVLAALDSDVRDQLQLLIGGASEGLEGRQEDLRDVLRRFEPTHRDLARVSSSVALRERSLRRLVHALDDLNTELASRGSELSELVGESATVFRAFASEQQGVRRATAALPGALEETTRTLGKVQRFAEVLRPAAGDLRPAVRALDRANRALTPLAREITPVLRTQVRPFVRDARPVARRLSAPAKELRAATPDLARSFTVLNHLFNMVGFNQDGREGPGDADRDEGFLFWLAWLNHNAGALFGTADAHGPLRPVTLGAKCSQIKEIVEEDVSPELAMLFAPALLDPKLCGATG